MGFDDTGLGQAMEASNSRRVDNEAKDRVERLEKRVTELEAAIDRIHRRQLEQSMSYE